MNLIKGIKPGDIISFLTPTSKKEILCSCLRSYEDNMYPYMDIISEYSTEGYIKADQIYRIVITTKILCKDCIVNSTCDKPKNSITCYKNRRDNHESNE